jgi:hypothetical protein
MHRIFRVGSIVLASAVLLAAAAASAEAHRAYKRGYVRDYVHEAPVKDCTRLNGRDGYYGNPWCSPQEQARFDRWEASRLVR